MVAFCKTLTGPSLPKERPKIQCHLLDLQYQQSVATVTLVCTETGNRIDSRMAAELRALFRTLGEDQAIRLVIIVGSDDTFSVERETAPVTVVPPSLEGFSEWISQTQVASTLAKLSMPVITAVNGDAFDHGLELEELYRRAAA